MALVNRPTTSSRPATSRPTTSKSKKKQEQEVSVMGNTVSAGDPMYWEVRYQTEFEKELSFELFDWYCSFEHCYSQVIASIDQEDNHQKVLIVGVGRSNVIDVLYEKGFRDIVAIDVSPTLIQKMMSRYEATGGVTIMVMDVRELTIFADNTFTLVIDKGCLDALYCKTDFVTATNSAYTEIFRVLKMEGVYASITYATPLSRVPYLRQVQWAIESSKVPEGEGINIFTMIKTEREELLTRKVKGAEAPVRMHSSGVISEGGPSSAKGGQLTVKKDVSKIVDMVSESADVDS